MSKNTKNLAILGSTGSIGQQTLDIVRSYPEKFKVKGLAAGHNVTLLNKQVSEFKPDFVYSINELALPVSTSRLSPEDMTAHPDIDFVIIATAGKAGLQPTLSALKAGKRIAIANKEVLVMAGEIVMRQAQRYKAQILPIDSEHSAIWQCLNGEGKYISRVILTASGGPFYHLDRSNLSDVSVEETLAHPTWKMGRKVTVDSATLMNKGLEAIEAHWLFSVPYENIEILIHPSSIIHSLVEFVDGSIKAQISHPDMHYPIQYALSYPERFPNRLQRMNLAQIKSLNFETVNYQHFPCLSLALEAGKRGGTYPAVLCAADEVAVELFLCRKIAFTDIGSVISDVINMHKDSRRASLEEILAADLWAREKALDISRKRRI